MYTYYVIIKKKKKPGRKPWCLPICEDIFRNCFLKSRKETPTRDAVKNHITLGKR